MRLTDFARKVPDDVWALFAPILPPVIWCGNGCPPYNNRECLHAVLYVLVTGIEWRMLPAGFPSYKTVQRRLTSWLELDASQTAWRQLAQRYEARRNHGDSPTSAVIYARDCDSEGSPG